FLTRSGTINSVHSFTQSPIGPVLLGFLAMVLVGSFTLFSTRAHIVSSAPRIDSFVSREGTFLANNLLLTVYAFVVLIGTTYPLLLEAFTGTQVGVGEPFFNRLAVPLSFALLLVMGVGPVTPWGSADGSVLWKRLRTPLLFAAGASVLTTLLVTRIGWVVLAVTLAAYVIGVIVGLLIEQAGRRRSKLESGPWEATKTVIGGDTPFWAGQLSHIGLALLVVGIAFAANLGSHLEVDMVPGDTVEFESYTVTYVSPFQEQHPNKLTRGARLEVSKDGQFMEVMEPAANFFGGNTAGVSTPDVSSGLKGDLYITLVDLDSEGATVAFDTSPMIWLIWLGGSVIAAGGFWSMSARRRERMQAVERPTADV
ncbi:MAG: cytochrome c-type biogenesis CcmF C-terminal domain-containing protein, partial [Actinomycetota bacterium]|nr:cytochrome c-type biogenesis CcmF C-terminal domain-containing protein [Actinomycetota bacterium]